MSDSLNRGRLSNKRLDFLSPLLAAVAPMAIPPEWPRGQPAVETALVGD
jgi:hypothetical protein